MLKLKVKRILLENQFVGVRPGNMTQLAAAMEISHKHLLDLLHRGREDDVKRIAVGLGIPFDQLSP